MASDPLYEPITADEFRAMDFGSDRKFELANGAIRMMPAGPTSMLTSPAISTSLFA